MVHNEEAEKDNADDDFQMVSRNITEKFKPKGLPAYSPQNEEENQIVFRRAPQHRRLDQIGEKPNINKDLDRQFGIVKDHHERGGRQHKPKSGYRLKK